MTIKLLAFGIAKEILHTHMCVYELKQGETIADLKASLLSDYPDFSRLLRLSFAVNESYVNDSHPLTEGDEVVLIPPVSGG